MTTEARIMTMDPKAADRVKAGDDFVCPNCGCEIRVRHASEPSRMHMVQAFICRCGVAMAPERHGDD